MTTGTDASGTGQAVFGVRGATHDYSGVVVLNGVDFELAGGTVHGLVGENGSGKSTLVKVLTGAVKRTGGDMYLGSDRVNFLSPAQAQEHGIGVVHQDYHLFPFLSVAENVFGLSDQLPRHRLTRAVDKRALRRAVSTQLSDLGIEISPAAPAGTLGPAEKKFVEIARAMLRKPRFLILDEPTASLEPQASRAVLQLLDRLRDQGVGLCLISHRLDEVLGVSDEVTVLRDGRQVAHHRVEELNESRLVKLIVSEEGGSPKPPTRHRSRQAERIDAPPLMRISGLTLRYGAKPIDLEVGPGEILGLCGLIGAGASKVVRLIAGADSEGFGRGVEGAIEIDGKSARIRSPRDANRLGIGYIPEDRKRLGVIQDASVATNISLASLHSVSSLGLVDNAAIAKRAEEARAAMSIRCPSTKAAVSTLSGGNQQKVLIARWMTSGSRLLAIEEPTHGVDVGGKAQVLQLLRDFADRGGAIVVASTEARDLLELCDQIVVLRHMELVEVFETSEIRSADPGRAGLEKQKERLEQIMVGQLAGVGS